MLNINILALVFTVFSGIFLIWYGYQLSFNTEFFIPKLMIFSRIKEGSIQYRYWTNRKNWIIHKVSGIGCIIMGMIVIVLPILKLLNIIH